tara:strand:+ start:288 stop:530 length:243 start_codon:yes stop_codon:yes gene_type:complete
MEKIMGVKGSWWRGGWTPTYADNHDKIFGKKKEDTMRTTPEMYLEMWLSEQIPTNEWQRILKERADVNELYQKHLEKRNA